MNKSQKELLQPFEEQILFSINEFQKVLIKYAEVKNNINHILSDFYIQHAVNGELNFNQLSNNGALTRLKNKIKEEVSDNANYELEILFAILFQSFKQSYASYTSKLGSLINQSVNENPYVEDEIKNLIDLDWSGIHYSERITKNNSDLFMVVWSAVVLGIKNGLSADNIGKQINKMFKSRAFQAQRLQETELARVFSQVTDEVHKVLGIIKLEYISALEPNTCNECASLHGEVFTIDDSGRPYLPRHPRCMCIYIAVI